MEEFLKKWDDATLAQTLALIVERGIRQTLVDASFKEEKSSLLTAAEMVSHDLLDLPWNQIRYIIKRKL